MCQTGLEKTVMLSFTVQQITTNLDYRTKKRRLTHHFEWWVFAKSTIQVQNP